MVYNVIENMSLKTDSDTIINKAPHYNQGSIECIDAMKECSTREEYEGFLKLTVMKYLWRLGCKDTRLENAKKANWYLNKLIDSISSYNSSSCTTDKP